MWSCVESVFEEGHDDLLFELVPYVLKFRNIVTIPACLGMLLVV